MRAHSSLIPLRESKMLVLAINDELRKMIILECLNGERNRNKDEIKDVLLLKLNYITVYHSFISRLF